MKRFSISALILSLVPAFAGAGDGVTYDDGVIFVNEDWYGHQNSTINFLRPDDPDGDYWSYRVIQTENPGCELGCTNQYGALWNGRFYMIAKQDKDPGASVTGGRISVAEASTMKLVKQLRLIDPSGAQCDGRAFVGVTADKGYVSTSNGIWILDLNTLEITGQVTGSENPNAGGDNDKPNYDPTSSLYYGQTGTMILAEGRVFAVHQQYGMLVIDPEEDKVEKVLDMTIVDDAVLRDTGEALRRPSGIGSGMVRSRDGMLWYSASKNVQGTGATLPYIIRLDPATLEREVIRIEGEGIYPPPNSWYAWTPDPFCASSVTDAVYWCGGPNSWFTNYRVFRFDTRTRKVEKILDFSEEEGDWHVYGCSLGIHPVTDELYASMFHKFVDPTYVTRRFDADGRLLKEYPMISNYWFPSLPVFPQAAQTGVDDGRATAYPAVIAYSGGTLRVSRADAAEVTVYALSGVRVASVPVVDGSAEARLDLAPGVYIAVAGQTVTKLSAI